MRVTGWCSTIAVLVLTLTHSNATAQQRSIDVSKSTLTVRGTLTLHGQTAPVTVRVTERAGHFTGSSAFRLTEFSIKPVRIAGGTVKVKDEVRIEFDIQLARH